MARFLESTWLKLLANLNHRGKTSSQLVYEVLDLQGVLDLLALGLDPELEEELSQDERKELQAYHSHLLASCLKELQRRRDINQDIVVTPDREIIQVIKDAIPVEDVIAWYTQVFYSNKERLTFRCTLHGEDKHPSGVIYQAEKRWWCFACPQGGDCFDAVMAWERCSLPQAIRKLATHLGIELRPLIKESKKRMGVNID